MNSAYEIESSHLVERYFELYSEEAAWVLEKWSPNDLASLFTRLDPKFTSLVLPLISLDVAAESLRLLPESLFKKIIPYLDPNRTATLISQWESSTVEERLALLQKETATELKDLIQYPPDSAGSVMDPTVTFMRMEDTVQDVLDKFRSLPERRILSLYVVDGQTQLVGVIPLKKLLGASPDQKLLTLIKREPVFVRAMESREAVVETLETQKLASLPVVDAESRLVGVIQADNLIKTVQQQATAEMQSMVGVSAQERANSNVGFVVKKRFPWLLVNLLTTFLAASVVSLFESTIAQFTALAVLLPVVAGQSGNTGAQALAVIVRGLALREIRTRQWFRIIFKESIVGSINGMLIGLACAGGVYLWSHSLGLALVIGLAMILAMFAAAVAGAGIPLILSGLRQDPAQSSSIILTTVTDVVGFFSFLGLAKLLSHLLIIG